MIAPADFCTYLQSHNISQYYGVPDSLLKSLCAFIDNTFADSQHVITANEGNAMAMATGFHLGSGQPAAVYLQNSGLGNIVNPLTSLCDPMVYSIPMLLIIGWRGEPGVKDEPQHIKQGAVTLEQLDVLGVPYEVIDERSQLSKLDDLLTTMNCESRPVAVVIKSGTFESVKANPREQRYSLKREKAIECILKSLPYDALVVSTTGKTSREVFEIRQQKEQLNNDFLTVGAMGHTASIALGVAMAQPERTVIALDGDGSMLMHMGAMAVVGAVEPKKFIHVVLNNQSHESVGGQPTVVEHIDIRQLSMACGYNYYQKVATIEELNLVMRGAIDQQGPQLIEVCIAQSSRTDLGRPTVTPQQNKIAFMQHAGSVDL